MKILSQKKYQHNESIFNSSGKKSLLKLHDLKLSLELKDKNVIQCASFQEIKNNKVENHACVSTQAGCKFGCRFCSSGKNGFQRNLQEDEIFEELRILAKNWGTDKFDCVVFMGTGEPLDNYLEVISCVRRLIKNKEFYNGSRKISLATIGIPKMIEELSKEKLPVNLWISLHAADDRKRKEIMPIAHNYSIRVLLRAAKEYSKRVNKPVWLNYMLFKGFNDKISDVRNLANILKGNEKFFNLILTEPNNNLKKFKKGKLEDLLKFKSKLKTKDLKNRIEIFITRGKNVTAGCGEFMFTPTLESLLRS